MMSAAYFDMLPSAYERNTDGSLKSITKTDSTSTPVVTWKKSYAYDAAGTMAGDTGWVVVP